jgi:predicted dehydrogenase
MIGIGIIGLGYWGPNLLRNFASFDEAQVIGCCDKDAGRAAKMARLYPGLRMFPSATVLIEDPGVELVVIATPVQTHFPLAKQALEAGKHVLVEKPLTASVAEAEELVEIAHGKGRLLMVDQTFVYHPAVEKLHDVIKRGELGDVCYYDSVRINLGLFQRDTSVLWDLAPHDISIMDHLIRRPIMWVQAVGAKHAGQDVETMVYLTVQYEDNILAHCHVNWLSPVKMRQILIGGSKRMAVYDDNLVAEKIKIYDRGVEMHSIEGIHQAMVQYRMGDMSAPAIPTDEALRRLVHHLLFCIRENRTPLTDGAFGLRVVKVLAAAERSMRTGQRVSLA